MKEAELYLKIVWLMPMLKPKCYTHNRTLVVPVAS